jgi:hypothetical protein
MALAGLPPGMRWLAQNIPKARTQSGQAKDYDADSNPHRPRHGRPPSPRARLGLTQTDSGLPRSRSSRRRRALVQKKKARLAAELPIIRDLKVGERTPKLTEKGVHRAPSDGVLGHLQTDGDDPMAEIRRKTRGMAGLKATAENLLPSLFMLIIRVINGKKAPPELPGIWRYSRQKAVRR